MEESALLSRMLRCLGWLLLVPLLGTLAWLLLR